MAKGPGAASVCGRRKDLPAHAISTKNKHLLLSCDTNPRFHGGCFGVWGTPPPKPLNCKVWLNRPGAFARSIRRHRTGDGSWPVGAHVRFVLTDILTMPFESCSLFPFASEFDKSDQQKTLLTCGKQGGEIAFRNRYLLTSGPSKFSSGVYPSSILDWPR